MAEAAPQDAVSVVSTSADLLGLDSRDIRESGYTHAGRFTAPGRACAIVFGTPLHLGGPAAQFKAFVDATGGIWFTAGWAQPTRRRGPRPPVRQTRERPFPALAGPVPA